MPRPRQQQWRQCGLPYLGGKSGAGSLARCGIRVPFTLAPLLWSSLPPSPTAHGGGALAVPRNEGQEEPLPKFHEGLRWSLQWSL